MKSRMIWFFFLAMVLSPCTFWAQTSAPKDPRAVSLLSSAVSALANGTNISSVTLTGAVTRPAGSEVENRRGDAQGAWGRGGANGPDPH